MKNKLKKFLCLLTAAVVISTLAACQWSSDSSDDNTSDSTPASASETVSESDTTRQSDSLNESETTSESETESESESESEKPMQELTIISPEGVVYPYLDIVKNYLESDKGVEEFYEKVGNAYAPVTIEWKNTYKNVQNIKVEYSINEDMSNAETTELEGYKTKLNLYNLLKGTKYYVRVTAVLASGEEKTAVSTFETTDLGARFMKIEGIFNVRDLGGYTTASGERTLQNMFFRGGALSPEINGWYNYVKLSESGKKYMSKTLGIKTDFDLRTASENLGLTESPIPNANLEYYGVNGYLSAFSETSAYRKVFSALTDKSKYPVYMHCTGGADRTGTVSFLVNALLGVDERTLIQDYELTSFSIYELRNYNSTTYQFKEFVEKLKTYDGDTLQKKTENYMLSIGVTETEIYNIKAIMLGKPTKTSVTAQESFTSADESYTITLGDASGLTKVLINDEEVNYVLTGNTVTIAKDDMPADLTNGTINGKLIINGEEYPFSFIYDGTKHLPAFPKGDGEKTLNSSSVRLTGETVIGYDGTIADLNVKSITPTGDGHGGTYFMIGSYGVYYRGSGFRFAIINSSGNYAEYSPRTEIIYPLASFNAGVKFGLSIMIKDDNTITVSVYINDALQGSYDVPRSENEISGEEAKFSVEITSYVTSLTINGEL